MATLYGYLCEGCGHENSEFRSYDERDEPMLCVECQGEMRRLFTVPTVNIIDRKTLRLPGRDPVIKVRMRSLGTGLGRIEPVKIGNAIHEMEQKYAKDLDREEQRLLEKGKKDED